MKDTRLRALPDGRCPPRRLSHTPSTVIAPSRRNHDVPLRLPASAPETSRILSVRRLGPYPIGMCQVPGGSCPGARADGRLPPLHAAPITGAEGLVRSALPTVYVRFGSALRHPLTCEDEKTPEKPISPPGSPISPGFPVRLGERRTWVRAFTAPLPHVSQGRRCFGGGSPLGRRTTVHPCAVFPGRALRRMATAACLMANRLALVGGAAREDLGPRLDTQRQLVHRNPLG